MEHFFSIVDTCRWQAFEAIITFWTTNACQNIPSTGDTTSFSQGISWCREICPQPTAFFPVAPHGHVTASHRKIPTRLDENNNFMVLFGKDVSWCSRLLSMMPSRELAVVVDDAMQSNSKIASEMWTMTTRRWKGSTVYVVAIFCNHFWIVAVLILMAICYSGAWKSYLLIFKNRFTRTDTT